MTKSKKRPETGQTLTEIARDMDLSDKALYQAQRRNRQRIADGSKEKPFPEPVREFRKVKEYDPAEIAAWYAEHNTANNPSRRRGK